MPLQSRRPDLPSLQLPVSQQGEGGGLRTPLRTPLTFSPLKYQQDNNMVMTPDTPAFDFAPSLDGLASEIVFAPDEWSENEDGLLQSYLMHPPRSIRNAYPPGSLPPAAALDEITNLLIAKESAASGEWRHSWTSTRARLFSVARQESMEATGGLSRPRLTASHSAPLPLSSLVNPPVYPAAGYAQDDASSASTSTSSNALPIRFGGAGGVSMSRQQHSMDSLYGGDDAPATGISEAMRLSSTLQTASTVGPQCVLTGNGDLSSPVNFTFNFAPAPRKAFVAGIQPVRPASLLQRGRSFTSADLIESASMSAVYGNRAGSDDTTPVPTPTRSKMMIDMDEAVHFRTTPSSVSAPRLGHGPGMCKRGLSGLEDGFESESPTRRSTVPHSLTLTQAHPVSGESMKRSQSSPVSSTFASSPSSASSTSHDDLEMDADETEAESSDIPHPLPATSLFSRTSFSAGADADEPITPLNQTFPHAIAMFRRSASMTSTNSSDSGSALASASVSGTSTPAITLTVESPEAVPTPRLGDVFTLPSTSTTSSSSTTSASSDMATHALSKLSLTGPGPLTFPSPTSIALSTSSSSSSAYSSTSTATAPAYNYLGPGVGSIGRGRIAAPPLNRSVSDSGMPGAGSLSLSSLALSSSFAPNRGGPALGRESKRLRGSSNRLSRSAGVGLSVLVPKPGGMAACEELKSPFEHKPVATALK